MTVLSAEDVLVVPLGSGSKGNCTWIGDHRTGVLIDCGLSTRQVRTRLAAVGLADAPIHAVLLTHEHQDHVAAVGVLDRHLARAGGPVPFLLTAGTARGLRPQQRPTDAQIVRAGEPVRLRGWTLEPHAIPHDTAEPVAWAIDTGRVRVGVITDLGHAPRAVAHLLAGLDVAVLESNHDEDMLLEGPYPWALKQRIRGRHGHLSNAQTARLLTEAAGGRLRELVLAHLSEENNRPELALRATLAALSAAGASQVAVHVAGQVTPTGPLRVGPRVVAPGRGQRAPQPLAQPSLFTPSGLQRG